MGGREQESGEGVRFVFMSTVAAMVRPADRPPDLQTIRRDHRLDQNQGQVAAESLPRAGIDPGVGCFVANTDKLLRPARLELSSSS